MAAAAQPLSPREQSLSVLGNQLLQAHISPRGSLRGFGEFGGGQQVCAVYSKHLLSSSSCYRYRYRYRDRDRRDRDHHPIATATASI
mmetsp:Transcript_69057/g.192962  ORF Transcript_69057/g.192962 Transcript_69057/m.192962 type:complete len:87 (-) Transcript_69057:498-758(-)